MRKTSDSDNSELNLDNPLRLAVYFDARSYVSALVLVLHHQPFMPASPMIVPSTRCLLITYTFPPVTRTTIPPPPHTSNDSTGTNPAATHLDLGGRVDETPNDVHDDELSLLQGDRASGEQEVPQDGYGELRIPPARGSATEARAIATHQKKLSTSDDPAVRETRWWSRDGGTEWGPTPKKIMSCRS